MNKGWGRFRFLADAFVGSSNYFPCVYTLWSCTRKQRLGHDPHSNKGLRATLVGFSVNEHVCIRYHMIQYSIVDVTTVGRGDGRGRPWTP